MIGGYREPLTRAMHDGSARCPLCGEELLYVRSVEQSVSRMFPAADITVGIICAKRCEITVKRRTGCGGDGLIVWPERLDKLEARARRARLEMR